MLLINFVLTVLVEKYVDILSGLVENKNITMRVQGSFCFSSTKIVYREDICQLLIVQKFEVIIQAFTFSQEINHLHPY